MVRVLSPLITRFVIQLTKAIFFFSSQSVTEFRGVIWRIHVHVKLFYETTFVCACNDKFTFIVNVSE